MHSTLSLLAAVAGFQLTITVLLAIVPPISATPFPARPDIQQRGELPLPLGWDQGLGKHDGPRMRWLLHWCK
ncbi:hypothetical protein EI94DRAFT_462959 [Lactarius quietus]|nr:hypothetical protein EI94DRAFT_462959 [Lactarius quietus]